MLMRKHTVKRYKKILAGVVAASLMISSMPVNAAVNSVYMADEYAENMTVDDTETFGDNSVDEGTEDITEISTTEENGAEEISQDAASEESTTELASEEITDVADTTESSSEEVTEAEDTTEYDNSDIDSDDGQAVLAASELTLDELSPTYLTYDSTQITVNDLEAGMILLSHCPAKEIADKKITISGTGTTNIDAEVEYNGEKYQYNPLGDDDDPFTGTIETSLQIKINKPLFNVVTSTAAVNFGKPAIWTGTDASTTLFANKYIFADGGDVQLDVSKIITAGTDCNMGNFIGTVTAASGITAGTLEIKGLGYASAKLADVTMASSSAGLICNNLEAGTIQLTDGSLPSSYTVTASGSKSHAGGIIGEMAAGTGLCIGESIVWGAESDTSAITVSSANGNAGGLVGHVGDNSSITINGTRTIDSITVTSSNGIAGGIAGDMGAGTAFIIGEGITINSISATGYDKVGGIAGVGKNVTFTNIEDAALKLSKITAETKADGTAYVGGLFGTYTETAVSDQTLPEWIILGQSEKSINLQNNGPAALGNATKHGVIGGLFGELSIGSGVTYTVSGTTLYVDRNRDGGDGHGTEFGGIAGIVSTFSEAGVDSTDALGALVIKGESQDNTFAVTAHPDKSKKTYYYGGLIGKIESAYVEAQNVEITAYNPFAYDEVRGFGGVAGNVGTGGVLKLSGKVAVTSNGDSDKKIWEGGGIVGHADSGSVIEFEGTTDISGGTFVPMYTVGLLVAYQENALIYAKGDGNGNGWTYVRPVSTNIFDEYNRYGALDDIGNYGQVIRLKSNESSEHGLSKDLIYIDQTTHKVVLPSKGTMTYPVDIPDADTFALLAIAIQSKGVFSAWGNINADSYTEIYTKDINLSGDVDLTGTGIYGLTRDSGEEKTYYKGTLDGNTHTIKLGIGEYYGMRAGKAVTASGNSGEVVRHTHQGIFAYAKNAIVKDLTIAGCVNINAMDHNRTTTDCQFRVGGFAGQLDGNLTATGVTLSESMNVTASGLLSSLSVGGLVGSVESKSNVTVGADANAVVSDTKIEVFSNEFKDNKGNKTDYQADYENIYAGGVIGTVLGNKGTVIDCVNVKLGGKISSDDNATLLPAGGLIGYVQYGHESNLTKINLVKVVVEEQSVKSGANVTMAGGLLGYLWADAEVDFVTPKAEGDYALAITGSTVTAKNADAAMGGLVYRANGKWQVNDRGISIEQSTFKAKSLGLLLCHMDVDAEQNGMYQKALYLEFTADWTTAYNLGDGIEVTDAEIFDEIAAYTAEDEDSITENGANGIISLETAGSKGVDVEKIAGAISTSLNTYENRTEYGKSQKTNGNSRYYYNLYTLGLNNGFGTSGYADTPQRLLAWSIYKYVPGNLKTIMFSKCGLNDVNTIGAASGTADLDMVGLSYYPVNVSGVTVQNAKITFYNAEIEGQESATNKTTTGSVSSHSQHYMMHCGLFYNMTGASSATVKNVTFAGSVGKVGVGSVTGSGALACGVISGDSASMKIYTLNVSGLTLDGIRVTDTSKYAPLLIDKVSGYTTIELSDVKTVDASYKENGSYVTAASSLIGQFGDSTATQTAITFNEMVLPDMSTENNAGIFTRATFLDSYQYAGGGISSAVYNFLKSEDWEGDGYTNHVKKVTYGSEISKSKQYEHLQHWYYDKLNYKEDETLVRDSVSYTKDSDDYPDFSGYLPYVYCNDKDKGWYEIKVNQRIQDLTEGCGTYGHPYELTTALDITTVADYINTGNAKKEWKIAVTSDQTTLHTDDSTDLIYRYNGTEWEHVVNTSQDSVKENWQVAEDKKTMSNSVMHAYIRNAYFDIKSDTKDNTISIENFSGFGTAVYPFRGVITCTQTNTTTIELIGNNRGLIPYSYGSVVRNINIKFSATENGTGVTVSGIADDTENNVTGNTGNWSADNGNRRYRTEAFWGGVMGNVLGGDNIIDNVKISIDGWSLNTTGGTAAHLVQAGGYVGSVTGGGVIFRNMTGKSGIPDGGTFYVNPYVGRVLDGYAFSEDCDIENGNVTKICRLDSDSTGIISTTGKDDSYNTQISSAQGLLVFSAIVNSGGATGASDANPGTLAYYGAASDIAYSDYNIAFGNLDYGKVRNADYSHIGKSADSDSEAETDFVKAVKDDTKTPGNTDDRVNTPYLVTKYADETTFYVCSYDAQVSIELTNADKSYDMTAYGNGYQGISVRYISNAVNTNNGINSWDFSYGMPKLSGFNGNYSTIKVNMDIKEYADDDFHGVSFGGVFNLIRAASADACGVDGDRYLVKDLTIDASVIKFAYYSSDGEETSLPDSSEARRVSVGGFAGGTARNGVNAGDSSSYLIENFKIQGSSSKATEISSPGSAGGFIGSTGMGNDNTSDYIGCLYRVKSSNNSNDSYFGVNLVNCSYNYLNITAGKYAGGFAGFVSSNSKEYGYGTSSVKSSLSVTTDDEDFVVGQNSIIQGSKYEKVVDDVGGVFGGVASGLYINDETLNISGVYSNLEKTLHTAKFCDVEVVSENGNAGGVIGRSKNNDCKLYDISVSESTKTENLITGKSHTGGVIGCIADAGDDRSTEIDGCVVENLKMQGGNPGAAGILGGYSGCSIPTNTINNCTVKGVNITAGTNCAVGGIIGNLVGGGSAKFIVQECTVSDSTLGDKNVKQWNGGLIGGMDNKTWNQSLYIYDSAVKNTTVQTEASSGNTSNVAGLISSANGYVYGSNILLDGVTVLGPTDGIASLICSAGLNQTVQIAGVSIKNSNTEKLVCKSDTFNFGTNSFIAFADYADHAQKDTANDANSDLLGEEDEVKEPYVSVSPKSELSVTDTDGATKYLHGDGAKWSVSADGKTFTTMAQTITEERRTSSAENGRYVYTRVDTDVMSNFDFTNKISTYKSNQAGYTGPDFPVLQISGGDISSIESYLDILTNGGYSEAVRSNGTSKNGVTAKTQVCKYDKDSGKFVIDKDAVPALKVTGNGTANMSYVASTDFDNGKDRFTLLTVTWDAKNNHTYSIQVPVLVKRILEIDFIATLGYGTHFRNSDYDDFTTHVLDSFDNPMTGYLTYIYNSAKGEKVSYGWQNYIDNGGDMTLTIDKKIQFNADLPAGTQLTMVDCQDDNRTAYYYTMQGNEDNTVALSSFRRSASGDTQGDEFGKESIGEALSAEVEENKSGSFVEVDEDGKPVEAKDAGDYEKPTVSLNGKYYRLLASGEEKYTRYKITIDEDNTVENYYLVITIPKTDGAVVNGWIDTSVDIDIPHNVYCVLRNDKKSVDPHRDTASTYQISDGYKQELTETYDGASSKVLSISDTKINIRVLDKITFAADQQYKDFDQLYQRFVGSLQNIQTDENDVTKTTTTYEQFPIGTTGTVSFYVYAIDKSNKKHYYIYGDENGVSDTWTDMQDTESVAVQYPLNASSGNLDLVLSTDGSIDNAVSLQQVRDLIITNKWDSNIYVEAELTAALPATELDVIPVSKLNEQNVPYNYAKLSYAAQLSTVNTSLSYSNTKATLTDTKVKYYQEDSKGAKLTYDADDINQLGINLLDIGDNTDATRENSIINTMARFDLTGQQNIESVLSASSGIRFKLTLSRKNTNGSTDLENYESMLTDAGSYIDVKLLTADSGTVVYDNKGTWEWTIPKNTYVENGKIKTGDAFDGSIFTQAINLMVNISNVETAEHFYSNYKVELSAEILDEDGGVKASDTDNIIYTLTKIKPEFADQTGN